MANTNYAYVSSGNEAKNVRLIKNYALFLFSDSEQFTAPTGLNWAPPNGKKPIGYSSEDGAVLHPEAGDSTDYKAHNGDIVLSDSDPGYWTLQLAGIEAKKEVVEAYFDTTVATDGSISLNGAGLTRKWKLVLAALDQQDRPMLLVATNAKVSDRDDVSMKSSELMQFSLTFKLLKGDGGNQFKAWGFVAA